MKYRLVDMWGLKRSKEYEEIKVLLACQPRQRHLPSTVFVFRRKGKEQKNYSRKEEGGGVDRRGERE